MQKHDTSGNDFDFAKNLVRSAGNLIRSALIEGYSTEWKQDNTPVTTIDTAVNSMVIQAIKHAYPNDTVFGEEESNLEGTHDGYTWVLDPVDGTQALGLFDTMTVCLARLDRAGHPVFGVVYNPVREQLFSASQGQPSACNDEPIHVSTKATIKSSYIFFGSRIQFTDLATNGVAYDRLEAQGAKIMNARSLAFGCVMVALGKADGAYIGVKTPFEAAAVKLIVENAGGTVTDLYGNTPGSLSGDIQGLVVSNGLIHDYLVAALRA